MFLISQPETSPVELNLRAALLILGLSFPLLFSCSLGKNSRGHQDLLAEAEQSNPNVGSPKSGGNKSKLDGLDLSGDWEIQEEERSYIATLDRNGNGTYNWQNGRIVTTEFYDRLWQGTWHQTGNDREGGFEVLLSEDGFRAEGVWWYSRVGTQKNIPPREWGGGFTWFRENSHPKTGEICCGEADSSQFSGFAQQTQDWEEE